MKLPRLFPLMVLVIAGCGRHPAEPIKVSQDEYDVMSAVIDTFYTSCFISSPRPSLFVIEAYSALPPSEDLTGFNEKWPYRVQKPSIGSSRNRVLDEEQMNPPDLNWVQLQSECDSLSRYRVLWDSTRIHISRALLLALPPKTHEDTLSRFTLGYFWPRPGAGRMAKISRVAFNTTRDEAMVYYHEGGDGFSSMYFELKRDGSKWIVLRGKGCGGI